MFFCHWHKIEATRPKDLQHRRPKKCFDCMLKGSVAFSPAAKINKCLVGSNSTVKQFKLPRSKFSLFFPRFFKCNSVSSKECKMSPLNKQRILEHTKKLKNARGQPGSLFFPNQQVVVPSFFFGRMVGKLARKLRKYPPGRPYRNFEAFEYDVPKLHNIAD